MKAGLAALVIAMIEINQSGALKQRYYQVNGDSWRRDATTRFRTVI